jgi:hypothetical protein
MILHPFFCPNRRTSRPGLSRKSASRKKPDRRPAKAGPASQRPPPLPRFNCRHAASHNSALRSFRLARHRSSPSPAPPTAAHAPPMLHPCSARTSAPAGPPAAPTNLRPHACTAWPPSRRSPAHTPARHRPPQLARSMPRASTSLPRNTAVRPALHAQPAAVSLLHRPEIAGLVWLKPAYIRPAHFDTKF